MEKSSKCSKPPTSHEQSQKCGVMVQCVTFQNVTQHGPACLLANAIASAAHHVTISTEYMLNCPNPWGESGLGDITFIQRFDPRSWHPLDGFQ